MGEDDIAARGGGNVLAVCNHRHRLETFLPEKLLYCNKKEVHDE